MRIDFPILGSALSKDKLFICGGGGSAKTGIHNRVYVYTLGDIHAMNSKIFNKFMELDTGSALACGISVSADASMIAISVQSSCWVFEIEETTKTLTKLVKFRTDFAEKESEQSCVTFVGNSTLLTGGADGVIRIWNIRQGLNSSHSAFSDADNDSMTCRIGQPGFNPEGTPPPKPMVGNHLSDRDTDTTITLIHEYNGHTKRIKQIATDPFSRNLICSSGEDQSCHIWRLIDYQRVYKLSVEEVFQQLNKTTNKPIAAPPRIQFRCIQFSIDGKSIFTVLSPPRGSSVLVKWVPFENIQTQETEWRWIPQHAKLVTQQPAGSLTVSQDQNLVAVGAADGEVEILRTDSLVHLRSFTPHSFAITGLSFAKSNHPSNAVLITTSADKEVFALKIPVAVPTSYATKILGVYRGVVGGIISFIMACIFGFLFFCGLFFAQGMVPGLLSSDPNGYLSIENAVNGIMNCAVDDAHGKYGVGAAVVSILAAIIFFILATRHTSGGIWATIAFTCRYTGFLSLFIMVVSGAFGHNLDMVPILQRYSITPPSPTILCYMFTVFFGAVALTAMTVRALVK